MSILALFPSLYIDLVSLLCIVAVMGLEKTYYPVSEDTIGGIEICVTVNSSSVECPFAVTLTAIDGTAGM